MLILLAKWPLPLNGFRIWCGIENVCEMRERGTRFVYCGSCFVLWFLFVRRFSKIYSMSKDVELKSFFGHILYC